MDFAYLRSELGTLKTHGERLLEQLDAPDSERDPKARHLFEQFVSTVETFIDQTEEQQAIAGKRALLSRFQEILPPDALKEDFDNHKKALGERLQARDVLSEDVEFYAQFIALVEKPDLELTIEEGDRFDDFFGRAITRFLYQGKFSFTEEKNETIPLFPSLGDTSSPSPSLGDTEGENREAASPIESGAGETEAALDSETALSPADQSAERDDAARNFDIATQKEGTPFNAKAFTREYMNRRNGKPLSNEYARHGELFLLYTFAWMGSLTLSQLKAYLFNERVTEEHLDKLLANGYLSVAKHADSSTEFYIISPRGSLIYTTRTSREFLKNFWDLPTAPNGNSDLARIVSDPLAYERAATLGLRIAEIKRDFFEDAIIERVYTDAVSSVVHIKLYSKKQAELGWRSFIAMGISGDVFLIPADDFPESIAERETYLQALLQDTGGKGYKCGFSESGIYGQLPDGSQTPLEELITILARPADLDDNPALYDEGPADPDSSPAAPLEDPPKALTEETQSLAFDDPEPNGAPPSAAKPLDRESEDEPALRYDPGIDPLNDNPFVIARKIRESGAEPSNSGAFNALILSLLKASGSAPPEQRVDYIGRAVLLLKSLSWVSEPLYGEDYQCLLHAADLPLDARSYTGENIQTLFDGKNRGTSAHLAATLRALFHPDSKSGYYTLVPYAENMLKNYDQIFINFSALQQTLNAFIMIQKTLPEGFADKAISRMVDEQTKIDKLQQLSKEADRLKAPPYIAQYIKGLPELLSEFFGKKSLIGESMESIAESQNQKRDFVLEVYKEFLEGNKISHEKINAALEESWRRVRTTRSMVSEIIGKARDKIQNAFHERLEVIERWLNFTDSEAGDNVPVMRSAISRIKKSLQDSLETLRGDRAIDPADKAVLHYALSGMLAKLEGRESAGFIQEDWLSSGILPLASGVPVISKDFSNLADYEPWRNVLRHIETEPQELRHVLSRIETPEDPLYDNLGQAMLICDYLKDFEKADVYRKSIPNAEKAADKIIKKFDDGLKIDYAYGRIDETTNEITRIFLDNHKREFLEESNFGRLRLFISALRGKLDLDVRRNYAIWASRIEERRKQGFNAYVEKAWDYLQSEEANFIQVEEALNSSDGSAAIDPSAPISQEDNLFAEFIDPSNFDDLWRFCWEIKGKQFNALAPDYIGGRVEKAGLSQQYVQSAKELVKNLPNLPQGDESKKIKILLEELGFRVSSVNRANNYTSPARFTAKMDPDDMNRENYNHPICEMGTRIAFDFNIVELFGLVEPESIISEVRKVDSRHMPIVFLNGSLTLAQRKQLAKLFLKDRKGANPFVLVDWVLLLHLASKVKAERLRTMLACSLPYTGIKQLFSTASSSPVADEMYIGRSEEMSRILDLNGPVIVYGGRQLGKTALLQRARNRFHKPDDNYYSVFIDAKTCCSEDAFVALACRELGEIGVKVPMMNAISELCDYLRKWFNQKKERRLLMLIDEADKLLSSLAEFDNYAPLAPLEDLCRAAKGNFKFVFAGLHNVFLAAKEANTIFGHFGNPLCIKPMSQSDAYKLLARPLNYLGFSVNPPDMLLRLLVNTNFYPGVVHFVGAELINMLMSKYAEHYDDKNNPPYELSELQIGAIMNSAEKWIEDRILMTLEVDQAYLTIARCVALLYYFYQEKYGMGYTAEEILKCAADVGNDDLRGMGKDACVHLLSELCDMSILVEVESRYRFRQLRFRNIIGKNVEEIMTALSSGGPDNGQ